MTKVAPRPAERVQKLPDTLEAEVSLAALDRSDVRAIKVRFVRKCLLRQIKLLAPLT